MLENRPVINQDVELTGRLGTVLNRGDNDGVITFRLMLSMLQQDLLQRPVIEKQQTQKDNSIAGVKSYYPVIALAAQPHHWQQSTHLNQYFNDQQLACARLYHSMFPSPIAASDDATKVSDEVKANCDYYAQQRLLAKYVDNVVKVDETGLYDILNSLHEVAA